MSKAPPFSEAYWNAPKRDSEEGEKTGEPLYVRVGMALSAWERLEDELGFLFARFMEAPYPLAERVYGSFVGKGTKIPALEAASESAFALKRVTQEDKMEWKTLLKHYGMGMVRRNEIAHGVVSSVSIGGGGKPSISGWYLVPVWHRAKKTLPPLIPFAEIENRMDLMGLYRYTSPDLDHFKARFDALHGWVSAFTTMYLEKYLPPR